MITKEFIDFLGNESSDDDYSLFFISWIFFYHYGLNNEYYFNLFCNYSKSQFKNSNDNIISDLSNYEMNENITFPWNQSAEEQNVWFPKILNHGSNELIHIWRAYMNVWVQISFNNRDFIIIKKDNQLAIKILSNKILLKGFGFLERVNRDIHWDLYSKRYEKFYHSDDVLYTVPYFVFGPLSILEDSEESCITLTSNYSYTLEYAWRIEVFTNFTPPRIFLSKRLIIPGILHYKALINNFTALMITKESGIECNNEIYRIKKFQL